MFQWKKFYVLQLIKHKQKPKKYHLRFKVFQEKKFHVQVEKNFQANFWARCTTLKFHLVIFTGIFAMCVMLTWSLCEHVSKFVFLWWKLYVAQHFENNDKRTKNVKKLLWKVKSTKKRLKILGQIIAFSEPSICLIRYCLLQTWGVCVQL